MADTTVIHSQLSWPGIDEVPRRGWRRGSPNSRSGMRYAIFRCGSFCASEVWAQDRPDAPTIAINDPDAFFRRVGQDGMIGFSESHGRRMGCGRLRNLDCRIDNSGGEYRPADSGLFCTACDVSPLQAMPVEARDWRQARRRTWPHYDLSNERHVRRLPGPDHDVLGRPLRERPASGLGRPAVRRSTPRSTASLDSTGVGAGTRYSRSAPGGRTGHPRGPTGSIGDDSYAVEQQAALAASRVTLPAVDDRVAIRLQNYRDAEGRYDAIVSVEMIEAVGCREWPTYFMDWTGCSHRVERSESRRSPCRTTGWRPPETPTAGYTSTSSPAVCFPRWRRSSARSTATDLNVCDRLSFGEHYAATLRLWRGVSSRAGTNCTNWA